MRRKFRPDGTEDRSILPPPRDINDVIFNMLKGSSDRLIEAEVKLYGALQIPSGKPASAYKELEEVFHDLAEESTFEDRTTGIFAAPEWVTAMYRQMECKLHYAYLLAWEQGQITNPEKAPSDTEMLENMKQIDDLVNEGFTVTIGVADPCPLSNPDYVIAISKQVAADDIIELEVVAATLGKCLKELTELVFNSRED